MNVLWLSHEKYVTKILEGFNMSETKPVGSALPTNCKVECQAMPKRGEGQGQDEESTLCVRSRKFDACYGLYESRHRICSQNGESIHE